jgi:hypothetical protein
VQKIIPNYLQQTRLIVPYSTVLLLVQRNSRRTIKRYGFKIKCFSSHSQTNITHTAG